MFHTILVPLDGSLFGEQALPLACSIVQQASTHHAVTLHLVHVHVPIYHAMLANGYSGNVPVLDDRLDADSRNQEHASLRALCTRLASMTNEEVRYSVIDGPVVTALAEYAAQINADAIVMTTHGRGGMSRVWLGSVADKVVRHGSVPTLLLRPHDTPSQHERTYPIRRVLIPLDGSPLAEQAIEPACTLGDAMNAEYVLMQVVPRVTIGGYVHGIEAVELDQELGERQCANAQAYLEAVAQRLDAGGKRVSIKLCCTEQPALGILETARQCQADVIALATHGRGGVRRWLLGSVADKVVRAAQTPVLLRHPQ
jgi:nucleotide-binding universal stress UspA family protein